LLGQNVPQADIGTPYLTLRYGDTGDFYIWTEENTNGNKK